MITQADRLLEGAIDLHCNGYPEISFDVKMRVENLEAAQLAAQMEHIKAMAEMNSLSNSLFWVYFQPFGESVSRRFIKELRRLVQSVRSSQQIHSLNGLPLLQRCCGCLLLLS